MMVKSCSLVCPAPLGIFIHFLAEVVELGLRQEILHALVASPDPTAVCRSRLVDHIILGIL